MCSLAKTYVDEIVGGDGKRRYNLVRDDGSMAAQNVQIVKAYTPEQEGSTFGALDIENLRSHSITLSANAAAWTGDDAPYSQTLYYEYISDECHLMVGLADTATADQRQVCRDALLFPCEQAEGSVKLLADGYKPEIDLPITITVLEVM